jgi:hypothetical protein
MSIRRITISVPAATAARIKRAAGHTPVSAWVTGLIEERLDDLELDRLWHDFYRSVAPRRTDARRAGALFKRLTRPAGRKSAA